ncbi:MAG TPA: lysophospholipid acyltransferase family protein [Rhodanobacteraceae bacterium]|nr:lysophospholipid acyltransferase family protein [Rhodanobacteraceae bacterium]
MRWYTLLLYAILRAASRLPLRALHASGAALGWLFWISRSRKRRIVEANLARVRQQVDEPARRRLARACLVETGKSLVEVFGIWGRAQRTLDAVREVRGGELFDAALASGKGLILCAPHLGSWEVANYWIGARTAFATFYTQPRYAQAEALLRRLRGRGASIQFPIDDSGVRRVFRHLSGGGVVSIMPDHVPRSGGLVAPFFGVPALTMSLLPRLAARTGANVLMLFVERLPKAAGFVIHFRKTPESLRDADLSIACTALNAAVADCVQTAFTQYQWNYKRFKPRPGSGLPDIYRGSHAMGATN